MRCPHPCFNICLKILCGVPTPFRTSDQIHLIWMCGAPPPLHLKPFTQKKALTIILGKEYVSYENALFKLGLERLDSRRLKLCYKFALKCTKSVRHSSMFPLNKVSGHNTRNPKKYEEPVCSTSRYFNICIPYMTRLLNNPPALPWSLITESACVYHFRTLSEEN